MTLRLLPVEVPMDSLSDPTSRVITPQVINAYIASAGDFMEAVSATYFTSGDGRRPDNVDVKLPYCLLRARKEFIWDADHNPADFEENWCRGEFLTESNLCGYLDRHREQQPLARFSRDAWCTKPRPRSCKMSCLPGSGIKK